MFVKAYRNKRPHYQKDEKGNPTNGWEKTMKNILKKLGLGVDVRLETG